MDCLNATIEGLKSEKAHIEITGLEQGEFRAIYEKKAEEWREKYNAMIEEYNDNKQILTGCEEVVKRMSEKNEELQIVMMN